MIVDIQTPPVATVSFGSVNPGQVIWFQSQIYITTDTRACIRLTDGTTRHLQSADKVQPVDYDPLVCRIK